MNPILGTVLYGAAGGLAMSVTGYLRKPKNEFDIKKFIPTVALGAIFGGVAGYSGMEISAVETSVYAGSVSQAVNWLFKAVYRRLFPE